MNRKPRAFRDRTARMVGLVLAVALLLSPGAASAQRTQYLDDGATQKTDGTWAAPESSTGLGTGSCPADLTKTTKPECLGLRLTAFTTSATCVPSGSPSNFERSWSTAVCNDTVHVADQGTCEGALPLGSRVWSNGVCAIPMKGYNRNKAVCTVVLGGAWVTSGTCTGSWVMPDGPTYTPPLLTSITANGNPGPGDQCLRCHTSATEWNGPRVRDVETFLKTGHKNMSRKVVAPYKPWAGPHGDAYPTDDGGNAFNWSAGQVTVGGTAFDLTWIYGDWLAPLPRAVYKKAPNGTSPGISYSCGRCHTTGWTSDATLQSAKEPETSFSGITWGGVTPAVFGQVDLKGGVAGDSNKMSSWDVWGIDCARCHNSAVNNTGTLPYSAPTAMGSHHNSLTVADYPAACTVSGKRDPASCASAGGTWNYGYCTDPRFVIGTNPAASKTACEAGPEIAPGVGVGVWITPCSDNNFGNQAACTGTWTQPSSFCSIGTCSNPAYTTQPTCAANGGTWTSAWTDLFTCMDAGGKWTGSHAQRGQIITSLCMNCHRQEASGKPYDSGNSPATLKVGSAHGTLGFVSHAGGNQFLNSPHAKFSGTFAQIPTGKFKYDMTGEYKSWFMNDGEAGSTGNGCTGCHDIHNSMVKETGQSHKALREECTECHSGQYNVDLTRLKHPTGPGTPLETMNAEACVTCHMPGGLHLWRIKASNSYATYPLTGLTGTVNANTSPDGTYASAVWVDVDLACGQCHGGGTNQVTTNVSAWSSATLTVASTNGFVTGSRVRIAGAGALGEDGLTREDFYGTIKTVNAPNQIVLLGAPSASPVGKSLVQNPLKNGAHYRTKAELSVMAAGMHMDQAPPPNGIMASFTAAATALAVNVNASATTCSGAAANCDTYTWDFGDGETATGVSQSHTYDAAGTYVITLTVVDGTAEASTTRTVTVRGAGPIADGVCNFDDTSWTLTVTNTSTSANGFKLVAVDWNQGVLSRDYTAPFDGPFVHTYPAPRQYKVYLRAIDKTGLSNRKLVCTMTPAQFTLWAITGTVRDGGGLPIAGAKVQVQRKNVAAIFRNVYTASNGTYTLANMKPGIYTLTVSKLGYTFPAGVDITVGGNKVNDVNAQP